MKSISDLIAALDGRIPEQQQWIMNSLIIAIDPMGTWRLLLFAGSLFCLLLFLKQYTDSLGYEAVALWAWVLGSAIYIIEFPGDHYGEVTRAFEAMAGATALEALLIPLAVISSGRWIFTFLNLVMIIAIACVWCGGSLMTPWDYPSPSFDTALLAMYIPFAPPWLKAASLATIFTRHGSTAMLIVAAQVGALAYVRMRGKSTRLKIGVCAAGVAAIAVIVGFAYMHSNAPLFDGWTRLELWQKYASYWVHGPENKDIMWNWILFGWGPGSFLIVSILKGKLEDPHWLHSDWLEIPMEYGLIGLLLVIAVVWRATRNTIYGSPKLFAAIAGACAFGVTYHPLRHFPTMFVIAIIFHRALKKKPRHFCQGKPSYWQRR